jgi:hypothetical protein
MLLQFKDPIMIVDYGDEAVVKGSMKRLVVGAVIPFIHRADAKIRKAAVVEVSYSPQHSNDEKNNKNGVSDIALNHGVERAVDTRTSAVALARR